MMPLPVGSTEGCRDGVSYGENHTDSRRRGAELRVIQAHLASGAQRVLWVTHPGVRAMSYEVYTE